MAKVCIRQFFPLTWLLDIINIPEWNMRHLRSAWTLDRFPLKSGLTALATLS